MSQAHVASGKSIPAWPKDALRVTFGVIWLVDAILKWLPGFVASPAGGPDETFRIAGPVNPRLIVPAGARVTIQVINADPGAAHGLVITASHASNTWMPMMTGRPAFTGSSLWFLGNPTSAGMHSGTLTFTAASPGTYRYLCPVPGHARKGMTGTIIVTRTP